MGLRLFFLPGAMFIQGATFIPDSRVTCKVLMWKLKLKSQMVSSLGVSIQIVDMDIPYLVDLEDQGLKWWCFQ